MNKTLISLLCLLLSQIAMSKATCPVGESLETPKEITVLFTSVTNVERRLAGEDTIADDICGRGYAHWIGSSPIKSFEESILEYIGLPEDHPEKEKHISKFFKDNNSKLICDDTADSYIRENEHVLKRSLAMGKNAFLTHAAKNSKYDLDWNFYEMVDGEKETIIDYIEKIINDEELASYYDVPELKSLVLYIEQSGGKRGSEL